MSAISAKSLNSTLGTGNFRGFDQILGDMFSENRKMHYVPSPFVLFTAKKYQEVDVGDFEGELFQQNLATIKLKHGGILFVKGDQNALNNISFRSSNNIKVSDYVPKVFDDTTLAGVGGYFLQFEPDSTIYMDVSPVKDGEGKNVISFSLSFCGSLSAGEWDFLEDPIVYNYVPEV